MRSLLSIRLVLRIYAFSLRALLPARYCIPISSPKTKPQSVEIGISLQSSERTPYYFLISTQLISLLLLRIFVRNLFYSCLELHTYKVSYHYGRTAILSSRMLVYALQDLSLFEYLKCMKRLIFLMSRNLQVCANMGPIKCSR